jgi:nucleoid DNA-binding protein
MNKSELVEILSVKTDVSKAAAAKSIETLVEIITATVAKGDDVALIGFGTFKPSKRAARAGKNPKTGEALKIAATTVPTFKAGAAFKAAVAPKKKKK